MLRSLIWLTVLAAGQESMTAPRELDPKLPRRDLLARVRAQLGATGISTVAWGAYNAGAQGLTEVVPELRNVLAGMKPERLTDETEFVVLAVLDALVRVRAKLPGKEIAPWFAERPLLRTPALVLMSRTPKECAGFMLAALAKEQSDDVGRTLCNLMLAGDPAGLARLLADQVRVRVEVQVQDGPDRFRSKSVRVGMFLWRVPEGFPPSSAYDLTTEPRVRGATWFAAGPQPIFFRRFEGVRGGEVLNSCRDVSSRFDETGYGIECLLALVGTEDDAVLSPPFEWVHQWSGAKAWRDTMEERVAKLRERWGLLLRDLAKAGWIAREVAEGTPLPLDFVVKDLRTDKSESIPPLGGSSPVK